jgi:NADPH-dependent 2,4-dienoyl-CoA reductase/sulfur reductase-like enzyme
VCVVDRNLKPGGQLIKQIHKFFGSREHHAGVRGVDIAAQLLEEARALGVTLRLGWEVFAMRPGHAVDIVQAVADDATRSAGDAPTESFDARSVVLAAGAEENALQFEGWTLAGVMGAGAAQTLINVWRVRPGKRVLMVGAGNVGLIVTYQLLQAGVAVAAIIEAAPRIGGYGVHAAKIRRTGVPILTSHTILRAEGDECVEGAVVAQVDGAWRPVEGTERRFEVDVICVAVGLHPNTRLASLAGCGLVFSPALGGWVPLHNAFLETTVPGIYVAGDAAGIEEASTALEEGHLAGIAAYQRVRDVGTEAHAELAAIQRRLDDLRGGPFCGGIRAAKSALQTAGEIPCPAT